MTKIWAKMQFWSYNIIQLKLDTTHFFLLGLGSTMGAYSIIAQATSTESAIFEALQENWDTFTYFMRVLGASLFTISKCTQFLRTV